MDSRIGYSKGRDSIYLCLGALVASLTLIMGLSADRAYAYHEISVSDLELSSKYVKPSGEVEFRATITNTGSETITDTYADVSFPSAFTLLAGSEDINIGTLGPWESTKVSWRLKARAAEGPTSNEFDVFAVGSTSDDYVDDEKTSWLSLHIDGVPPTVTTSTKPKQFSSRESIKLTVKANDSRPVDSGIGGFRYQRLVNGGWVDESTKTYTHTSVSIKKTHTYTCLNGRTCTFRTVAVDGAGNEAASQPYTATVDTQAPVLNVDAPTRIRANKTLKIKYSAYDPGISGLSSLGLLEPYSKDHLATTSSGTGVIRPRSKERYGKKSFKTALNASDRAGNIVSKQITVESVKAKPKFRLRKAKLVKRKGKRGKKGKTLRFTVTTSKLAEGRLKASIIRPKGWKRFKLSKKLNGKGKVTFRFKIPRKGKRRIKVKLQFFGDKIYKKYRKTRVLGCGKKRIAWCKKSSKKKKKKAKKK